MAEKSPLLEVKDEQVTRPSYDTKEETYLKGLRGRMEDARNAKDGNHEEWDGMDYINQYLDNERLANTFIKPKVNKEDTNFQSGTIRMKLFALLSAVVNLDLKGDISAFNKDGFEVQALGDAMEDVSFKTNELDNDDEKKFLRQYELLKHGTVFVEELWDEKKKKEKKTKGKFKGSLKFDWTENVKKAFARPTRNIIPGLNVYLGDITKYDISDQPFIFTIDTLPYSEAKRMFGDWDRWENVPRKLARFDAEKGDVINKDWTLLDTKEGYVEVLRYQDKWNNEFAILLNGVLMTPVGLPLPWGYEDYNIAQQNLEPIHSKFAYGKSLVARIKNKVAILDEAERMAILKNQKSYAPPRYNISGRMVTNRVFSPGKINYGLQPGTLPPLEGENEGVSNSEFAFIQHLEESINSETTSPTFSGQQAKGDPTATEIVELQRQAKMVLGLTIFSVSMLEWKLEWLRLKNLLANWFQEEDKVVDEAREMLVSKFRKVTTDRLIDGEGMGKRILIPSEEIPSAEAIMQSEDYLTAQQGVPVRLIFLHPDEVTSAKLVWQITVTPRERKTSEVNKLLNRAFMADVIPLQPNIAYLQQKVSSVWEENAQKLFAPNPIPQVGPDGMPIQPGTPEVGLPSPAQAAGRELNQALKVGA